MPIKKGIGTRRTEISLFKQAKENHSGHESIGNYIYDHGSPSEASLGPDLYENYRCATQDASPNEPQWLENRINGLNKKVR